MGRINGIGIVHLSGEERLPDDSRWATLWFTFIFLPIFPIRRERLFFAHHQGTGYAFSVIEGGPFNFLRILRTYLFSWLFVPLMVGVPGSILVIEVWRDMLGFPEDLHKIAFFAWIVWFGVWVWKLADWHEDRFRPSQ